jgi:putative transposase
VNEDDRRFSIRRRCEMLGVDRSGLYYEPHPETQKNLDLMGRIDRVYTAYPFYGSRRIGVQLESQLKKAVSRKRVQRLMRLMGIEAIYQKPRTSIPHPDHKVYPYLLRDVPIVRPNQVWSTDITYVGLAGGFVYVTAVIDWYTRFVLSWGLSNTMDVEFCLDASESALATGATPEVFNTDQGSQYTSPKFTGALEARGIQVSMNGRGRALDNVFVERLWRSYKYEEVFIHDYSGVREATAACDRYFHFYNNERPHQSLGYTTPASAYFN